MIPDLDIWRAANLLIRQHGENAEIVAAQRVDDLAEREDYDGPRGLAADQSGCGATGNADRAGALIGTINLGELVAAGIAIWIGAILIYRRALYTGDVVVGIAGMAAPCCLLACAALGLGGYPDRMSASVVRLYRLLAGPW